MPRSIADTPHPLGRSKTKIHADLRFKLKACLSNDGSCESAMVATDGARTVTQTIQRTGHQNMTPTPLAPIHVNSCESGSITLQNSDEQAENIDDDSSSEGYNDQDHFDSSTNFVQELEERIEAALEIETIFSSVSPQIRSQSLGKSLPERPCNPIIKDKFFAEETFDNVSMPNSKMAVLDERHVYMSKYRDCSPDRQRIIIQEDYEAVNEMHQLLLFPQVDGEVNKGKSCSASVSETSSIESDFSQKCSLKTKWGNNKIEMGHNNGSL